MKNVVHTLSLCIALSTITCAMAQTIPLPEHPRPDFQRDQWQNLNGPWAFEFDSLDEGISKSWSEGDKDFSHQITVPFPWGSKLSGVADLSDIAWYKKEIKVNPAWKGKRIFFTIGASDWETTVWLDGKLLGTHQGGYTPFSFELTPHLKLGQPQSLVIRADDKRRDFTLYGKQGYGNARGIWQTVYLEARGNDYAEALHFAPNIDSEQVTLTAYLPEVSAKDIPLSITIQTPGNPVTRQTTIPKGKDKLEVVIDLPKPRLWSPADPYLYYADVKVGDDLVHTYFGMRKISVMNLPGTDFRYVALNDKPLYLQLTLDQSYHPEGYYTFPSDAFMKAEIERTKSIGLTGIRTHIKVEIPRKLYWADQLGVLVMADLPNSWGDPDERMQEESETTFREMVKRDFNHPAIFSWILFNETWGLRTHFEENGKEVARYLPKTQMWVASMYYLAKSLDATRLVEDNSICCGAGHTQTDINSFHDYLPGWEWEARLKELTEKSFEGSTYQFEAGFKQGTQPKINSECGNVWGYDGSTGDVDWSWDYHRMMNTFRKYPEMAGWLYTEHHDVINEWNGYWRFDRSKKFTGLEAMMPGMKVNDFHADVYLSTGNEICKTVDGGSTVRVPLYLSSMTDKDFGTQLKLSWKLQHTNSIGETLQFSEGSSDIPYQPYAQQALEPLTITVPDTPGLSLLQLELKSADGTTLHHNLMNFEVTSGKPYPKTEVITETPSSFSNAKWSSGQWDVLNGKKVCGAGNGFFEFTFKLDPSQKLSGLKESYFLIEAGAKELFDKDRVGKATGDVDFMLGAKVSPSSNPNAYPMTDEKTFPSKISVTIDGKVALTTTLQDDPADHRGVLSWHHQLQDRKLREAGSYGYYIKVPVSKQQLADAVAKGEMVVRLTALGEGGIAVYGKSFGQYPFDPSLVMKFK